ncbi:MAG: phosphate signaling complex protein PhoU [Firmicutes bacterium]|nr:phosphate signaling complex protein PhoU [Bacillota bacterium]
MVRESFQEQLNSLRQLIIEMGEQVEKAIDSSMLALVEQNLDLAEKVVMDDEIIDKLSLEVEDKCTTLLALQQPMARDLRLISTAMRIHVDLERMGDYACNIAKTVLTIGSEPFITSMADLHHMAELARRMISQNLAAYSKLNRELALQTAKMDHEIDYLFDKIFKELLALMTEDPRNIKQSTYLSHIAKYLERIGDRGTNLSESIMYMINGERVELNE